MDEINQHVGNWRKGRRRARRLARRDPRFRVVDGSFFKTISELARTVKNLVHREGNKRFPGGFLPADVAVMLNQLRITFDLLIFINCDERRDEDPSYRHGYSFVALPLIRTLIDGFYNITFLLDHPTETRAFRLSGYKKMLDSLKAEEQLYGKEKGWPEFIAQERDRLRIGYEDDGFGVLDLSEKVRWNTLSIYLQSDPALDDEHKKLMRRFSYGPWRQYSEMSHVSFRGVHELFIYLNTDDAPHEQREMILERAEREMTTHLGRAAAILLALLTEIQAAFSFDGHNVNQRLHAAWRGVLQMPEGEEMFNLRYRDLMNVRKILDSPSVTS